MVANCLVVPVYLEGSLIDLRPAFDEEIKERARASFFGFLELDGAGESLDFRLDLGELVVAVGIREIRRDDLLAARSIIFLFCNVSGQHPYPFRH